VWLPSGEQVWGYSYWFRWNTRTWQMDGQTPHDGISCAYAWHRAAIRIDIIVTDRWTKFIVQSDNLMSVSYVPVSWVIHRDDFAAGVLAGEKTKHAGRQRGTGSGSGTQRHDHYDVPAHRTRACNVCTVLPSISVVSHCRLSGVKLTRAIHSERIRIRGGPWLSLSVTHDIWEWAGAGSDTQ